VSDTGSNKWLTQPYIDNYNQHLPNNAINKLTDKAYITVQAWQLERKFGQRVHELNEA
jgi:hypothetical protein